MFLNSRYRTVCPVYELIAAFVLQPGPLPGHVNSYLALVVLIGAGCCHKGSALDRVTTPFSAHFGPF